ncbi:Tigger transposable element-derived protein 7 [Sciurus carolinensis]|uniref:Tigger transposable element-derived protein 7 n=1 Tax=Sciurus carolinensis TaxID=30640 RepID=A0AA41N803_SCICA|nr:Tigger transposable element-derived protein 7 [Sciurus carolinensis]
MISKVQKVEVTEILDKCGETKLDDDKVWFNGDDEEKSCPPKPKDGITKGIVQREGIKKQAAEFMLSAMRESLDYLVDVVDATPEFKRLHFTLKEMQQEVGKKQFQSRIHLRIGRFLRPRPHKIKDSFNTPSTSGSSKVLSLKISADM